MLMIGGETTGAKSRRKPRRVDNESRGLVNCHTVTATTI
jgi:hypothetical protein